MRISDWSSDVCSSDLHGVIDVCKQGGSDVGVGILRCAEARRVDQVARALPHRILDNAAYFTRRFQAHHGPERRVGIQWIAQHIPLRQCRRAIDELAIHAAGHIDALDAAARLASVEISAKSDEHTSELQSLMRISYAVFCLKNKKNT